MKRFVRVAVILIDQLSKQIKPKYLAKIVLFLAFLTAALILSLAAALMVQFYLQTSLLVNLLISLIKPLSENFKLPLNSPFLILPIYCSYKDRNLLTNFPLCDMWEHINNKGAHHVLQTNINQVTWTQSNPQQPDVFPWFNYAGFLDNLRMWLVHTCIRQRNFSYSLSRINAPHTADPRRCSSRRRSKWLTS